MNFLCIGFYYVQFVEPHDDKQRSKVITSIEESSLFCTEKKNKNKKQTIFGESGAQLELIVFYMYALLIIILIRNMPFQ